jgi:hypothetical protein
MEGIGMQRTFGRAAALGLAVIAMFGERLMASSDLGKGVSAIGITPTALAASGVSSGQATALLVSLSSAGELATFLSARSAMDAAQRNLDAVESLADGLDPVGAAAIGAAREQLAGAKVGFEASRGALTSAFLAACDAEAAGRLRAWWASSADVPAEMRIVPWSAGQLAALRRALMDERVAASGGEVISAEEVSLLAQTRSRPDVTAAAGRLQANVGAIGAAMDALTH